VEFLAVTLWDSIETIKTFSGPDPGRATIEPEGRAALLSFDEYARNYEVGIQQRLTGAAPKKLIRRDMSGL